jgi:hypothetical protein
LLLLLFVVKSFTDVHRWMNVDDDIFFSSLSLSLSLFLFFLCMFNTEQQKWLQQRTPHHVDQYHRRRRQ